MRQYTKRDFIRILKKNGYFYSRNNGSHEIYVNRSGNHISVPRSMNMCITRRLIKENNLFI